MSYLNRLRPEQGGISAIMALSSAVTAVGAVAERVIHFGYAPAATPVTIAIADDPVDGGKNENRGRAAKPLQLVLDMATYRFILALVKEIEAESIAELFRRAVQASEFFIPVEEAGASKLMVLEPDDTSKMQGVKRLNIPVSAKTRDRLDRLKASTGANSYTGVARDAFLVLAQLIEHRNKMLDGKEDCDGSERGVDVAVTI